MDLGQLPFYENRVLFGYDPAGGVTAVEVENSKDRCEAVLFIRDAESNPVRIEREEFKPFVLVSSIALMSGFDYPWTHRELSGDGDYRHIIFIDNLSVQKKLTVHLKNMTGVGPGSPTAPYLQFSDPVNQYLLITGKTLFKGMVFEDLLRMQLDIETYCTAGYEFSNADREGDRIIMISLSDSTGWERVIRGDRMDEASMLKEMLKEIALRDPDVIEGHNIHRFDLEYIEKRAARHKIKLRMGREGRLLKRHPSRMTIAERNITYTKYEAFGRHIIDTWLLAQLYDVSARELESYGLKDIARHFKVSPPDRTYVEGSKISVFFDKDPDTLARYALDDVRETCAISRILSSPYFLQTQIFPYSYQNVSVRGNATRIDSLFLREYIRRGQSIPKPPRDRRFAGAYTDIFHTGVVSDVIHVDVASLYPSIMLTFEYFPPADRLKVFGGLLKDLKEFRLMAKKEARTESDPKERDFFDALQNTFKILINSFYGYLGFSFGHFADFDMAEAITAKGREIITQMVEWLKERQCFLIELDTDGIYFSPPPSADTPEKQEALVEELNRALPQGINLELDGRYKAMFSYKMKNYILLDNNNEMVIKGSGLKSRGLEKFQRDFIEEMFYRLLTGRAGEIEKLLMEYRDRIRSHQWEPADFQKSETLQESLNVYADKIKDDKRNPAAVYELALQSGRDYQPGDMISYYVTGQKAAVTAYKNCKFSYLWDRENPDENTKYYTGKLESLYKKFRPFMESALK